MKKFEKIVIVALFVLAIELGVAIGMVARLSSNGVTVEVVEGE